jgi:hypothetical protein
MLKLYTSSIQVFNFTGGEPLEGIHNKIGGDYEK